MEQFKDSPDKRLQIMVNNSLGTAIVNFMKKIYNDYAMYPNGSKIFVNITTAQQADVQQKQVKQAQSGWLLPQSIWQQKYQQLFVENRSLRMLALIQQYCEQAYIGKTQQSKTDEFYNLFRAGKLIEASNLAFEASQMLTGYLAMHSLVESPLQQFGDFLDQARSYAASDNDVKIRAVFGVISGYDEPLRQFLNNQLSVEDEIWSQAAMGVNCKLAGRVVDCDQILSRILGRIVSIPNGSVISQLVSKPEIYLEGLISNYDQSFKQNSQIQLKIQKEILEQALFFIFNVKSAKFEILPLIQLKIKEIQTKIIEVYTRQLISTLREVEQASQELKLDDLEHQTEKPDFVRRNLKESLKLLPVIALSLQKEQVNDVFVMFSKNVLVNRFFVELMEESIFDQQTLIECRLNILRAKLQYQIQLGALPEQNELVNAQASCQLQEVQNLLFVGRTLPSATLAGILSLAVVHRLFSNLLAVKSIKPEQELLIKEFVAQCQRDCEGQQFATIEREIAIFKGYLDLEALVQKQFLGELNLDRGALQVGQLIQLIDGYAAETGDVANIIQIEMILNPKAGGRQAVVQKMFKKMRQHLVMRMAQIAHWNGDEDIIRQMRGAEHELEGAERQEVHMIMQMHQE